MSDNCIDRYTVYPDNKNHPTHQISEKKRTRNVKNVKKNVTAMESHFKRIYKWHKRYIFEEYPGIKSLPQSLRYCKLWLVLDKII